MKCVTKEIKISNHHHSEKIFFTAIAATSDYVCVSGYMAGNQHNALQLIKADLSKETHGPKTSKADSRIFS